MASPVELYAKVPETPGDTAKTSQIDELKAELAAVATEFARIVEDKAIQTKDFAVRETAEGLEGARGFIRAQPLAALAIATILGATLAIILVPKPSRSRGLLNRDWGRDWGLDSARAELSHTLDRLKSSMPDTSRGSLMSSFERVMDSVANIDPKASLMPAWEKLAPYVQSLKKSTIG